MDRRIIWRAKSEGEVRTEGLYGGGKRIKKVSDKPHSGSGSN